MIEKVGSVRNPLTVIAIFAGLAEVAGTGVLPLLEPSVQSTYVWFLMGFPTMLVLLFFATLFLKHRVLYAPSDFRSDEAFWKQFVVASTSEKVAKIERETLEIVASEVPAPPLETGAANQQEIQTLALEPPAIVSRHDIRAAALLAEELVVGSLGRDSTLRVERNVAFTTVPNVVFDAVAVGNGRTLVVEVKYNRSGYLPRIVVENAFERADRVFRTLSEDARREFEFLFALVVDGAPAHLVRALVDRVRMISDRFDFRTTVRLFDMNGASPEALATADDPARSRLEDQLANRIITILTPRSRNLVEILDDLGAEKGDHQALVDVQAIIGELIRVGRIESDPASTNAYRLVKRG